MKKLKILAHFADSGYTPQRKALNTFGPLGYYRIVMPAKQIKGHKVDIIGDIKYDFGTTIEESWDNIFKKYDVFWTNYFSDEKIFTAMHYYAQKHGKKIVFDIDDNYLDIPKTNKLYDRFGSGKRERAMLSTILSFADAITTSTFPLKEKIQGHIKLMHGIVKPMYVIPNMNDTTFWKQKVKPKWNDSKITIGYAGSNSHQDDLQMIMPAISKLMKKYKNLHFQLLGSIEKDLIPTYFKGFTQESMTRIEVGAAESIFKEYPAWLGQQAWDIAIAPLVDTAFTRCKSHIKWLEYSMFKMPVVASRVYPYFMPIRGQKVIEDGVTGLLARSNEWEEKLEKLILDKDLRKTLADNAYKDIKKNWQYKDSKIGEILEEMLVELFKK